MEKFKNREEAGSALAEKLENYKDQSDVVVLGLPRGGVPVAEKIAGAIGAPLGVFVVRKLGVPGHEELAMGAIGSGGVRVMNDEVVRSMNVSKEQIDVTVEKEQRKLKEREEKYRGQRPELDLQGKTVILVDDGIATGATMKVSVKALRQHKPAKLVVAVPVAPPQTCRELEQAVDELICPVQPANFGAIGAFYDDFSQTSDEEVREILQRT
jgi:predicted phosphoribosyltransferase